MKSVIALVIALNSFAALAGGHYRLFTKSFMAQSEEDLIMKVEAVIPSILNGSDAEVKREFRGEECWPVNDSLVELRELKVAKIYAVEKGVLAPYFTGTLSFAHKNCK